MSVDRLATTLAGRYRIERELEAGAMATDYPARGRKHDRGPGAAREPAAVKK